MSMNWVLVLTLCLGGREFAPQDPPEQEVASFIELEALDAAADDARVSVLYSCSQTEAVSAAGTVGRVFDRALDLSLQPDARANAIFVSGRASLVRAALERLRALDAATPERAQQPRRKPSADPAEATEDFAEGYGESVAKLAPTGMLLIGGVIAAIVLCFVLLRRATR